MLLSARTQGSLLQKEALRGGTAAAKPARDIVVELAAEFVPSLDRQLLSRAERLARFYL